MSCGDRKKVDKKIKIYGVIILVFLKLMDDDGSWGVDYVL